MLGERCAQICFGLREPALQRMLLVDDDRERFLARFELVLGIQQRLRDVGGQRARVPAHAVPQLRGVGERCCAGTGTRMPPPSVRWSGSMGAMGGFVGGCASRTQAHALGREPEPRQQHQLRFVAGAHRIDVRLVLVGVIRLLVTG